AQTNWKSAWKRAGVNSAVQRAANWGVENRIIKENPFKGLRLREEKNPGREMKPEEFQGLMRNSDPYFRRFLVALKMTGARPGELASLRWSEIDWEKGIAVKEAHKTRKKTGRPRVLIFPDSVRNLLAWIHRHQHGPAATELGRILEASVDRRVKVREVVGRMKAMGFSYRALYRAREAI